MTTEERIDEIITSLNQGELITPPSGDLGHREFHRRCAAHVTVDGLWMEFGVYRGRTICNIAATTTKTVYGFDSFEGLHEHWDDANPKGVYSLGGSVPEGAIDGSNEENPGMYDSSPTRRTKPWPSNVQLVKGYFENTLPGFLADHPEPAAYLHIDSDLYSSCCTVLNHLKDRIVPGTLIVFDELIGYGEFRQHEIKSFAEFLNETGHSYQVLYLQNPHNYGQVCVKIQ